ncbi:MAG: potassium transporter TrkG [Caldilineaceae bacterium]
MHIQSVIHILGLLLTFIAAAMLLPLPVSWYYQDDSHWALLGSSVVTFAAGYTAYRLSNLRQDLRAKEGFAIVTLGWIAASLFGSLPFMLSGAIPSLSAAYFETMSGFTTTGATILTDIEIVPHGILFWRSLTHWLGGMGIIVLSLAILPYLGVGGMQLFKAEVPGPVADKLTPRIAQTAKLLWGVYVLLTLAEVVLLMLGGMSLYNALCHSFATMSTGGYSTLNASVGGFNSAYIDYVITFFMFISGANFALHYHFLRGDFRVYLRDKEFLVFAGIVVCATLIISLDIFRLYEGAAPTLRYALFQVVSIGTSTGFGTADFEQWSYSSQFLLLGLMFIGGCAGSTAGGLKVMRIHLLFKFILSEITRLIHPNAIVPVRVHNAIVSRELVTNVLGFFVLYISIYGFGVYILSLLGLDLPTAISAAIATLSNIGPGLGDVGPTDNYASIPALGKWFLSLFMLMGRLEIFTVVILFSPFYWRK